MDWFRLYGEFATDPKVQMLSEAMQRRLIMLFCLECSNGIETFHVTERETSIAFAMRITDEEIAATKALFVAKGFINDDWTLCNWNKRQYVSDSSTARVRAHRERKKQEAENSETDVKRFSNALEQNRTEQNRTDLLPLISAHDFDVTTKFAMRADWLPSEKSFAAVLTLNGLDGIPLEHDHIAEFKSYWIASPDEHRTQGKWEHALAQHLKRKYRNGQANGRSAKAGPNQDGSEGIRYGRKGPRSAVDRVRDNVAANEAARQAARTLVGENDGDVRPPLDVEFWRQP